MRQVALFLSVLLLAGCLQTRQSQSQSTVQFSVGPFGSHASSQASHSERQWTGPGLK